MNRLLLCLSILAVSPGVWCEKTQAPMRAVYAYPAESWEEEALPLGNGHIGAMVFGGIEKDVIQINEKTLWSGGLGEDSTYNGGHLHTNESANLALQEFRKNLQKNITEYSATGNQNTSRNYPDNSNYYDKEAGFGDYDGTAPYLNGMLGTKDHFGSYQTLGNIIISDIDDGKSVVANDYVRTLDIDEAIQYISYTADGVEFKREYFISYPDNVLVVHLSSSKPVSRKISVETPHSDYSLGVNDQNQIVLEGWPTPVSAVRKRENDNWKDFLRFGQVLGVHSTDGRVESDGKNINVYGAKDMVIVMSASTNYNLCFDSSFDYIDHQVDPVDKSKKFVDNVYKKSLDEIRNDHLDDYKALYAANKIVLGRDIYMPESTTDSLLVKLKEGSISDNECRYLETLYYQFGRYLLISCSRPGSLPANLQGLWCDRLAGAWNSDYHTNINVQMNYWPAEQTNLSECHLPMTDFVRSLEPRGRITAGHYHCKPDGSPVRGWTAYHEVNAWGNTAPAARGTHSYFPEGALWVCQDLWEHYQFSQDKVFLKDNYPTLLNACLFWVDNLWEDERDGSLVANPSLSPEHGEFSLGCTATQGIIYEMFSAAIEAATILGREKESEIKEIIAARERLSKPSIGSVGQFMEWKDEVAKDLCGDGIWNEDLQRYVGTHRHTNHLYWLHPGSQIVLGRSDEETGVANAMKKTLDIRGDEGTGWSRAWKLNFWARLHDGDRAHSLLKGCLNLTSNYSGAPGGVYKNLFDAHPPFQIDGNLGVTSGIAEMLLQSQGGYIELLPALPEVWKDGGFNGMCARGGYTIDAQWTDGRICSVSMIKKTGDNDMCLLKFPGASNAKVKGATVKKRMGENELLLKVKTGKNIEILCD